MTLAVASATASSSSRSTRLVRSAGSSRFSWVSAGSSMSQINTVASELNNRLAVAKPMPPVPPATTAVRLDRLIWFLPATWAGDAETADIDLRLRRLLDHSGPPPRAPFLREWLQHA